MFMGAPQAWYRFIEWNLARERAKCPIAKLGKVLQQTDAKDSEVKRLRALRHELEGVSEMRSGNWG
jgi:hypothetical protein